MIDLLLKAIPDSDENCNLKRAEIRRWYQVYGNKIICPRDMENIFGVLSELLNDGRFWDDNVRLDNAHLGWELLKRLNVSQQKEHSFVFNLYKYACLLCSEDQIRSIFYRLDSEKDWPIEKYVPDILSRYGPLVGFWSHYINVVGVESPNPVVLRSFEELLSKYSEDLDVNSIDDIWKCGFECAKEEGSREALEFFWSKLKHQHDEKEKEGILLNVGINAYSLCSRNKKNCSNLVEFALRNLGSTKYKYFTEEALKSHKYFDAIFSLIDNYLYNEAKELISAVDQNGISHRSYEANIVSGSLVKIHEVPCELKWCSFDFFAWLWKLEKFEEHRQYCLGYLDYIFRALVKLPEFSVLIDPLKLILSSMSQEQIRRDFAVYSGWSICSALYTSNEREFLQNEILKFFKDGDKFLNYIDKFALNTLKECKELKGLNINNVFDLYRHGETKEFMESIKDKIDDPKGFFYWLEESIGGAFGKMIEGKIELDQSVSSQISDLKFNSFFNSIRR